MSTTEIAQSVPIPPSLSSGPSRNPIVRRMLPEELARRMRDMIVAGELRPGGRITMQRLCARFGVSRTPVREALKVLAAEGLVRLIPNCSAVVEPITLAKIDEVMPIVGALEILAGQLACAQVNALMLSRLEALHERLAHHFRHGEERAYMETADAICSVVFAVAANDSLSKIHQMLLRQLRWSHVADRAPPEWSKAAEEQEQMLRALQVRDADLWTLLASRHLRHRTALLRLAFSPVAKLKALARAQSRQVARKAG
ncbi:GntR family transcriptional regulator [Bradyrhizobium sp.]|uniref:GntR family transcriptional regulator n=1 Tax=Bradyrhizobium sp. TaxID=376 RepID=UPI002CFFFCDF|nr:GntR family transcriptional regulator [Bradyrhizobium sp.]HWX60337.1 GntR family transcriptional regulator [Bradyrhizobium sp.]